MRFKKKKLLKIYTFLILFLFLIFLFLKLNGEIILKYIQVKTHNYQITSKIESEEKKTEKINKKLEILKTEHGQERILIEKNNLKRPGERVIKILDY